MAVSQGRRDWAAAAAAAKELNRIEDVAARYGVVLKRAGRELVGLSPLKPEKTPSFYIDPRKQVFKCFASGEGGDVIKLVEIIERCSFGQALERLGCGTVDPETMERLRRESADKLSSLRVQEERAAQRKIDMARFIWGSARRAEGTLVETYLRSRGIDCGALKKLYGFTVPPTLRFIPSLDYAYNGVNHCGPAMIGVLSRGGRICGVHRTWLARDGIGKADLPKPKLALGQLMGGLAQLTPSHRVGVIGEGYETVLSVVGVLAREGRPVAAFSSNSLGNLAGGGIGFGHPHPSVEGRRLASCVPDPSRPGVMLPDAVEEVTLLGDADGDMPSAEALMQRAAAKFRAAGKAVAIAWPPEGQDFNDMVRAA